MKVTIEGFQGEGKTTFAKAIAALVLDTGHSVELLDGGVVTGIAHRDGASAGEVLARTKAVLDMLPPRVVIIVVEKSK